MKFKLRNLFLALIMAPAVAAAQNLQTVDEIVALVEDDVILRSELNVAIDQIVQQVRARGENLPPRHILETQVLERLVLARLEKQRAESTGIRVSDADVDQALAEVARRNNLTLGQMRLALESQGIDFSEFRQEMRSELLSSRLRQRVVDSMDEITSTEVEILLASERFGGDEFHLSQIMIAVPESASPAQVNEAMEHASDIHRRLREGLDFPSAAITFSQSPDALEGGDVGWRNVNVLPRMIVDVIEPLQPGEFTRPLRTPGGILIIKVNDRRQRGDIIVREYRARHLMVESSELLPPDQAAARIQDLHEQLLTGGDFAELARRWSNDETTANIGGLLTWFPEGGFGPEIQRVIDSLEPGQISQPFQTQGAWHIFKLEDVREADRTEEFMRAEAREILRQQKSEEEVERFLRQMRDEAFVEVRL